jgi:putative phage-type endonuclease
MALQKIPIGNQSRQEWIDDRANYLGGSDMGTILGLNDYMSRVELFYQKLGEIPAGLDSRFTFMGRYMEDVIADLFQYWDGDTESIMLNYDMGRKVRQTTRTNFRFMDDRWPWISCNLDRFYRELNHEERGIIDCKNMMGWVERKWEVGFPQYHVVQLMSYLGIMGMKKGYVVCLVEGNRIEAYPMDFSQDIFDTVIEWSRDFWDRIQRARKVMADTGATGNELVAMLSYQGIEPEPEYNEAYEEYLKKRFTPEEGMRQGTDADLMIAHSLQQVKSEMKSMEARRTELSTRLMSVIGPAQGLEFEGTKNRITWQPDSNGKRTLRLYLEK